MISSLREANVAIFSPRLTSRSRDLTASTSRISQLTHEACCISAIAPSGPEFSYYPKGRGHEIDTVFYGSDGGPYLHVEAKVDRREFSDIVTAADNQREVHVLPPNAPKELRYVLDLRPAYFWLVGPGTVDPEAHVWRVECAGERIGFHRVASIPPAPQRTLALGNIPGSASSVSSRARSWKYAGTT